MPTIQHLPRELIGIVSRELPLDDIYNFRLTCKGAYDGSLHQFTRKRFETVCVMLDQHSLGYLRQVIEHPTFASAVRTLVVCSDHLSNADYLNKAQQPPGDGVDDANSDGTGRYNKENYSERLLCQTSLVQHGPASGRAVGQLSQILRRLPSCRAIVFSDSDEHDPIGRSRLTRDIGVQPLRSLVTDVDDDHPESVITESEEFVGKALTILLLAAARSGWSELHFEVTLGLPYHEEFINAVTSDMLSSLTARDEIKTTDLSNISTLQLVVYATTSETWVSDIIDFIALFSQLTNLRLNFKNRGGDRVSGSVCQELNVRNLRKLELSRLIVTETQLLGFLSHHKISLKHVTLEQIEFETPEGWPSFLSSAKDELPSCKFDLVDCLVDGDFWSSYHISTPNDYTRVIDDFTTGLAATEYIA